MRASILTLLFTVTLSAQELPIVSGVEHQPGPQSLSQNAPLATQCFAHHARGQNSRQSSQSSNGGDRPTHTGGVRD